MFSHLTCITYPGPEITPCLLGWCRTIGLKQERAELGAWRTHREKTQSPFAGISGHTQDVLGFPHNEISVISSEKI